MLYLLYIVGLFPLLLTQLMRKTGFDFNWLPCTVHEMAAWSNRTRS